MATQWNISDWLRVPWPPQTLIRAPESIRSRIWVYELPERFNTDVDGPVAMKHGVYLKAERIFHSFLLHSTAVTRRYREASLYFVPMYTGLLSLASSTGRRSARQQLVAAALAVLQETSNHTWPSRSRDHVFVATSDRGRCFQDVEDRFLDATVLMHDGTSAYPRRTTSLPFSCHRAASDMVIPPVVDVGTRATGMGVPEAVSSSGTSSIPWSYFDHRDFLFVWRGSASRTQWTHLGHTAKAAATTTNLSNDVRQLLLRHYSTHRQATDRTINGMKPQHRELVSSRKVDKRAHYGEMRSALFCLAPSGWAQWTVRFFEAVQLGCLPVTFLSAPQDLRMPFADEINYAAFSVNVAPDAISSVRERLRAIATNRSRLREMQRRLWNARQALDWTDLSSRGTFARILNRLANRPR